MRGSWLPPALFRLGYCSSAHAFVADDKWRQPGRISNSSCHDGSLTGYRTPDIDDIADKGMHITNWFADC